MWTSPKQPWRATLQRCGIFPYFERLLGQQVGCAGLYHALLLLPLP